MSLEDCIDGLKNEKLSSSQLARRLSTVVKAFSDYSTDSDHTEGLPTETLIPTCLFTVPAKLKVLFGLTEGEFLKDEPASTSRRILLQMYLKALWKLLSVSSEEIKHVIVQSMSQCVQLVIPFKNISRRWVKTLVEVWSASAENLNLSLRCFTVLGKFAAHCQEEEYMWCLRRAYVGFFQNSKQLSWRNLQHVNFMINCYCQLVKTNLSRAYYILFGYIRSLALQVDKMNSLRKKDKVLHVRKLYCSQTLNCFRLLVAVVSRVESQQLSGLLYPLNQLLAVYSGITQAAEFLPLKLHLLASILDIMEMTGVYVPHCGDLLLRMTHCSLFGRKLSKKGQAEGEIDLGCKLSETEMKSAQVANTLFRRVLLMWYRFGSIVTGLVGGVQILQRLSKRIKDVEFGFSGYSQLQTLLVKALKKDSDKLSKARAKRHLSLHDVPGTAKFQRFLKNKCKLALVNEHKRMKEQDEQILKQKLLAEREDGEEQIEDENEAENEEANEAWEQPQSGASDFVEEPQAKERDESDESINYQGDPEDAEREIAQWSQHQWSSQEQEQ